MNILHLGPIYDWTQPQQPFNPHQMHQYWYKTLTDMDHNVRVFIYNKPYYIDAQKKQRLMIAFNKTLPFWYGRWRRFSDAAAYINPENRIRSNRLREYAKRHSPDMILLSGETSALFPSTLKLLKQHNSAPLVLFNGINPLVAATPLERHLARHNVADLIVTNDPGYKKGWQQLGARHVLVLPYASAYPDVHKRKKLKKSIDVCFVGTLFHYRQRILEHLLEFDVQIWGKTIPTEPLTRRLKPLYNGPAFGKDMADIYNKSRIALNIQPPDMTRPANMRTFEIPACGTLQIADNINPDFYKEGSEYVRFSDVSDLRKKIRYYLNNKAERKAIADAGYKRTHKDHTYRRHFENLFTYVKDHDIID